MPSVPEPGPPVERLLRPLARSLIANGVTANHLAMVAVAGSVLVGLTMAFTAPSLVVLPLLPAWFLVRAALDAMAVVAAHEQGHASRAGDALHEVGDVLADLALYLPLAAFAPERPWPVVAFAVGGVLTEFCGVLGPTLGAARRDDGPMGRTVRALLASVLALLGAMAPGAFAWWPVVLWSGTALALVTCWNRVAGALREPVKLVR